MFSPKLGKNKNIKNVKFPFALWSYYDKLKKKVNKDNFYDASDIEKYISFSNNACESLNSYIKTFIPLNQNVSTKVFAQVIKNLFIKNSPRRLEYESINDKKILIKRNMSDILIEIVEITRGKKLLKIKDIEKNQA